RLGGGDSLYSDTRSAGGAHTAARLLPHGRVRRTNRRTVRRMEQRSVLPSGSVGSRPLTPDEVAARLAAAPRGGPRRSQDAAPRGDHDLNPGRFPDRPLVPAAVLVPLISHPTGLTVLFTLRTPHLADHAGQISFPGGRIDPGDADEQAAALRESEEETGVAASEIRLV